MTPTEMKLRTKQFAHRCIRLTSSLPPTYLANHVSGQLIRSSTSTAANYRAACIAQTTKSFVLKISISVEECDESHFWLEFISDENLLPLHRLQPLIQEASELTSILIASRKTAEKKLIVEKTNRRKEIINNQSTIINKDI